MSTSTRPQQRRTNFARYTPPGTGPTRSGVGGTYSPARPAAPARPARVLEPTPAPGPEPTAATPEDTAAAVGVALVLLIGHGRYTLRGVPREPGMEVERLYLIRKLGAPEGDEGYHVAQHFDHASCSCPDYVFRRADREIAGCKHVRALAELGLVETFAAYED